MIVCCRICICFRRRASYYLNTTPETPNISTIPAEKPFIARIVLVQTVRNGIYRMILCRGNADLCVGSCRYFYSGGSQVAAQMANAAGK